MAVQVKRQKNRLLAILRQDSPKNLSKSIIPSNSLVFKKKIFSQLLILRLPSPKTPKIPQKTKGNFLSERRVTSEMRRTCHYAPFLLIKVRPVLAQNPLKLTVRSENNYLFSIMFLLALFFQKSAVLRYKSRYLVISLPIRQK